MRERGYPNPDLVLYFAIFLLFFFPLAYADEISITPTQILSGDEILLPDNTTLRLADIKAATPEAKSFLEATLAGHLISLQDATTDRYGRITATATLQNHHQSVEEEMLRAGVAFVYPATGDADHLDTLLAQEHAAHEEKRGYWATQSDTTAENAAAMEGKYGFIIGTVTQAVRIKSKLSLNFGAAEHPTFTITIAPHNLRAFKRQGLDPLSWQGQKLRVRGWVTKDGIPTITVSDPHQIELL